MKVSPISLVHNSSQELIAVDFGNGRRAEHEDGIEKFRTALGVNPDLSGLDQYAMQFFPKDSFRFDNLDYKKEMYYVLQLDTSGGLARRSNRSDLRYWFDDKFYFQYSDVCRLGINSAWNKYQFVIVAHEKYEDDMKSLYNSFTSNDILVGYSPVGTFNDKILKFSIKSKVELLSKKDLLHTDDTGRNSYQHIEWLISAKDRIYDDRAANNAVLTKREFKRRLMDISSKLRA